MKACMNLALAGGPLSACGKNEKAAVAAPGG